MSAARAVSFLHSRGRMAGAALQVLVARCLLIADSALATGKTSARHSPGLTCQGCLAD